MKNIQLCFPLPQHKLGMPSEAQAAIIIDLYKKPWTFTALRAEARRLHCESTHTKDHHELLRFICDARLAAQESTA